MKSPFFIEVILTCYDMAYAFREAKEKAKREYFDLNDFDPYSLTIRHMDTIYEYKDGYSDIFKYRFEVK